jgi:hypothetical protein
LALTCFGRKEGDGQMGALAVVVKLSWSLFWGCVLFENMRIAVSPPNRRYFDRLELLKETGILATGIAPWVNLTANLGPWYLPYVVCYCGFGIMVYCSLSFVRGTYSSFLHRIAYAEWEGSPPGGCLYRTIGLTTLGIVIYSILVGSLGLSRLADNAVVVLGVGSVAVPLVLVTVLIVLKVLRP